MEYSRKAKQGIEYIQHLTGKKFVQREEVQDGKIHVDRHQQDAYKHEEVANSMLKIIQTTPGLTVLNRRVMSMKIYNPGISDMQVALSLGIREADVKRFEEYGKRACIVYMQKTNVQEATARANADRMIEVEVKNLNKAKHNSNPLL